MEKSFINQYITIERKAGKHVKRTLINSDCSNVARSKSKIMLNINLLDI